MAEQRAATHITLFPRHPQSPWLTKVRADSSATSKYRHYISVINTQSVFDVSHLKRQN
jgi:hypothetical protein